jgi:multicomponent Na+:H+ antiporter subunit D
MTALMPHVPALLIAVPLLGAFLAPIVGKLGRTTRNGFVALVLLVTAALAALLAVRFLGSNGSPILYVMGGPDGFAVPLPSGMAVPIRIMFEIDAMNVFMVLITALVTLCAGVFSFRYLRDRSGGDLFYALFLLLTTAVLGLEVTGDLFNFFVFLEITSIAACGLIGFQTWQKRAPEAAYKVMTMYTLAGIFVLLAIGLLYAEHGGLNMAYLASAIRGSVVDQVALTFLFVGLGMKAAAVPLHMWAPDAYGEAPAPVSAVLVANSQASLYGLFRVMFTIYGGVANAALLGWLVVVIALVTIFVGVTVALLQNDLKRLIAYGALSQIGYMLLGVGVALVTTTTKPDFGFVALQGGIFHMINDAACIGLLFLTAGAAIRAAGTRDLNRMGGLAHTMRLTSVLFIVGALALAGIPPFNGFASKFLIYEGSFQLNPFLAVVAVLSSILLLAVFLKAFQAVFLGPRPEGASVGGEAPLGMLVPMVVLAAVVIGFGLFPGFFVERIVTPAARALWYGRDAYIHAVLGGF